jgi:hypothetical protein
MVMPVWKSTINAPSDAGFLDRADVSPCAETFHSDHCRIKLRPPLNGALVIVDGES